MSLSPETKLRRTTGELFDLESASPTFRELLLDSKIPPILHQTWKNHVVPDRWKPYQQSWKDHHPEYEYKYWTDADIEEFMLEHYPHMMVTFHSYEHNIQRVDLVRAMILDHYGGVYVDMDYQCFEAIDDVLITKQQIEGEEDGVCDFFAVKSPHFWETTQNSFMGSIPRHPIWSELSKIFVERAIKLVKGDVPIFTRFMSGMSVMWSTGPLALDDALTAIKKRDVKESDELLNIILLDQEFFRGARAFHHNDQSWSFNSSMESFAFIFPFFLFAIAFIYLKFVRIKGPRHKEPKSRSSDSSVSVGGGGGGGGVTV